MSIKAILFDLDGTLLPMDFDVFVKTYFGLLAKKLAPYGYEPQQLIRTIWEGTSAMLHNDGSQSNEAAFWNIFTKVYGEESRKDIPVFDSFYENEFNQVKEICGFNPQAVETVRWLKENGFRQVLATSPIFPPIATINRMAWAGISPEDFEIFTTYENCSYCKPHPNYYLNLAKQLGLSPEECLMVGNDVSDDMSAAQTGMHVFLLTDCIINKDNKDISVYPQGDFAALREFIMKGVTQ